MSSVVTFPQNRYGEKRILVEFAGNLENHCLDFLKNQRSELWNKREIFEKFPSNFH